MNYILESMIIENELLTCKDYCTIYLKESENSKETTTSNKQQVGLLTRIINSIKKFLNNIKKFFQGDTEENVKKACDNIKVEIPDKNTEDAVKHLKSVINPKAKKTISEEDLQKAKENEKKLNECLKKGAKIGAIGITGATIWGLYQTCHGFQKYAKTEEEKMNKIMKAIDSDTSENGPSDEVKKAIDDYNRFTNPLLITVNNICANIANFAVGYIPKLAGGLVSRHTGDIGYKLAHNTGQSIGNVVGNAVGSTVGNNAVDGIVKHQHQSSLSKEYRNSIKDNRKNINNIKKFTADEYNAYRSKKDDDSDNGTNESTYYNDNDAYNRLMLEVSLI